MIQDRRTFIKASASAGTALILSSDLRTLTGNKKFDLKILATNWGFKGTLNEYCAKVKEEGYDGIEIWWTSNKKEQDEIFAALKEYSLEVGFLCAGHQPDYAQHFNQFKEMVAAAAGNSRQKPLYINCHSGRDHFSYEENKALINYTIKLAEQTGIKICHETHRSRMLFAASVGKQFMEKNSGLRITLDVSHWCNVSESLLHDQQQAMQIAIQRTDHIHARIGHEQGPQVSDPRAPEWENAVKAHLNWWDAIVDLKKKKGESLTILTEFGPPNYMPTQPYSREPLADQWAINVYMMHLLRKRYLDK